MILWEEVKESVSDKYRPTDSKVSGAIILKYKDNVTYCI